MNSVIKSSLLNPGRRILANSARHQSAQVPSRFFSSLTPNVVVGQPNVTVGEEKGAVKTKKNIFTKLWEQYSIKHQGRRIDRAERLFRAAQCRAMDDVWFSSGRIPNTFRTRHAIMTMHLWFVHKRLTLEKISPEDAELVQEELFEMFWYDSTCRIRAEGINEMMVNKNLKEVQQLTIQHCVHYDHAFTFEDPVRRREELVLAIWKHVLLLDKDANDDVINRLAMYVEWQYENVVHKLPENYWQEGRIEWGNVLDFKQVYDNNGKLIPNSIKDDTNLRALPNEWVEALTQSGDKYYWNHLTMDSQWDKPRVT